MSLNSYFLLGHYLSSNEMVVGWLMLWLVTMEVRGSYPSIGMVEPLRPRSGLLAMNGPHAEKNFTSGLHA
jgi:hypothetical protein